MTSQMKLASTTTNSLEPQHSSQTTHRHSSSSSSSGRSSISEKLEPKEEDVEIAEHHALSLHTAALLQQHPHIANQLTNGGRGSLGGPSPPGVTLASLSPAAVASIANTPLGLQVVQVGNGQLALKMQPTTAQLIVSSQSPPGPSTNLASTSQLSLANLVTGSLSGISASVPMTNLQQHISAAIVPPPPAPSLPQPGGHIEPPHPHAVPVASLAAAAAVGGVGNAKLVTTNLPLQPLDTTSAAVAATNKLLKHSPTEAVAAVGNGSFLSSAGALIGSELGIDTHPSDNPHSSDTSPISNTNGAGGGSNSVSSHHGLLGAGAAPQDIKGYILQDSSLVPQSMNTLSLFAPSLPPNAVSPVPQQSLGVTSSNTGGLGSDVSVVSSGSSSANTLGGGSVVVGPDGAKKREMRLYKNREAARECRRKKKEYLRCLENRVQLLESQNRSLIEELRLLKEHYQAKEHQLYASANGTTAAGKQQLRNR
ncbi:uncharacterized protein LOC142334820 [Convolutriloba macropyga]|uniref:uncharacterized protein LOC142334820 n=1 Tax=Convolutriloba macropyga TaxID=536237 RepID=UPI003F520A78